MPQSDVGILPAEKGVGRGATSPIAAGAARTAPPRPWNRGALVPAEGRKHPEPEWHWHSRVTEIW
jgi:hypothetical protein